VETVVDVISLVLLLAGSFFAVVGGIGLIRLPCFFARFHGAGITDTLGAGLILTGLMFQGGLSLVTVKLAMVLFFLLVTSPTSTHALAKAALHQDVKPRLANEEDPSSSA
jgi:multicomponent Na+:H+ antiporter subunit G